MTSLLHDLRFAVRQLLRTPGFTAAAIVTLALGIGANTTFFAAINAVVFRPQRAVALDGIYVPQLTARRWLASSLPLPHVRLLQRNLPDTVEAADAFTTSQRIAHTVGNAERLEVAGVTGAHAAIFRITPQAGRFIAPEDDRDNARVAVISDRLWRDWYGARREVVDGGTIRIDDETFQIVGVAPFGYRGMSAFGFGATEVWVPIAGTISPRDTYGWSVHSVVRLVPGTMVRTAEDQIEAIVRDGPMPPQRRSEPFHVRLERLEQNPRIRRAAMTLLTLSLVVLMAACANLANMLYARGVYRAGEVAVRQSLGASRFRIVRLLVIEAGVLATAASALGLLIALIATAQLNAAFPSFQDRSARVVIDLTPDYRVFAWAFAAGSIAAFAVGSLTAWRASRVPPMRAMARGDAITSLSPASRRVRLGLVALQVTAAVMLMMTAALFLQQSANIVQHRPTFDTRPLAAARIDLRQHGYNDSRGLAFYERLLDELRATPGIEGVALSSGIPASSIGGSGAVFAAERVIKGMPPAKFINGSYRRMEGDFFLAWPGFLDALGIEIERGRSINEGDRWDTVEVAVMSRSVAEALWPNQEPLGKRFMVGNDGHWRTVVGISADPAAVLADPGRYPDSNLVVVPFDQQMPREVVRSDTGEMVLGPDGKPLRERYLPEMFVIIRSPNARGHVQAIRQAVSGLDSRVAVLDPAAVDDSVLAAAGPIRAARVLMGSLGLLALTISTLGVYGVLSFLVARRRREFGIRLALGAQRRQVLKMVLDEAVHVLLVGLLAGVFVASVSERLIDARRVDLFPNEISTWVAVLFVVLTVGLVAALIPGRRAAAVDPNIALRDL